MPVNKKYKFIHLYCSSAIFFLQQNLLTQIPDQEEYPYYYFIYCNQKKLRYINFAILFTFFLEVQMVNKVLLIQCVFFSNKNEANSGKDECPLNEKYINTVFFFKIS